MWTKELETTGLEYRPASLTIFSEAVDTACGTQASYIGPFYCPADQGVYLDITFFDALSARTGVALGDGKNARSVRVELQADCFAGVWAHSAYRRGELTAADFEDALRAAAVVGDDFQQLRATGTIVPENWTHGSSAQRQHWLTTGFEQGRPAACDTFS